METKKVLILGASGMIGSIVEHYFHNYSSFETFGTYFLNKNKKNIFFSAEEFIRSPHKFLFLKDYDYIINCIGIIKQEIDESNQESIKQAEKINAIFPHTLAEFIKVSHTKIIQIATDCVFDGTRGNYVETDEHNATDIYGKTKSKGEVRSSNVLHIRCSVIGPNNSKGLMGWFLSQKDGSTVEGLANHLWNGATTLQFAQLCEIIIKTNSFEILRNESYVHHFIANNSVSKYELLSIINKTFQRSIIIKKIQAKNAINRSLSSNFSTLSALFPQNAMTDAIASLYEYIQKHAIAI